MIYINIVKKRIGLTVSLGSSIASALHTAHGLQRKASSRNDKRLATLENIEAGKELKKGYEKIKEYQDFTPEFVKQRAESLIESSKIKQNYVAQIDKKLENPNMQDKGNIVAVGETIRSKSVALEASNDISLLAATNTSEKQFARYRNISWKI